MTHNLLSIVLPEAPAIPGLVFRHYRGAADLPIIAAVVNASLAADKLSERITAEGLANIYAHPVHWDPQQDTLLVEVNGTLIGYANTQWREEHEARPHFINLHLAPEWRGLRPGTGHAAPHGAPRTGGGRRCTWRRAPLLRQQCARDLAGLGGDAARLGLCPCAPLFPNAAPPSGGRLA